MTRIVRVTLLFVWLFPSFVQAQLHVRSLSMTGPDVERCDLKGPVRQVTQVQSPITNRKEDFLDGYSGQNFTKVYTKEGLLQTYTSRDDHNKARSVTYNEYNTRNRLVLLRTEQLVPDPIWGVMEAGQIEYAYNAAKNRVVVLDKRTIMGKPVNGRKELLTDSLTRTFVEKEYKQDTLIREQRYRWDEGGYVVEQISRFRKQPPEINEVDTATLGRFKRSLEVDIPQVDKAELDSTLRKLQAEQLASFDASPEWREDTVQYRNQYDAKGRLIEQESRNQNGSRETIRYQYRLEATEVTRQNYNKAGDLTSETISLQHPVHHYILSDRSRRKVGDKWNELTYDSKDYPHPTYRYRYDRHGNWIEQKQVDANGKQIGVALIRTIEYYR
ncbi:hypothetical protein GCM10027341_12170 [Spirosoma knui]